MQTFRFLEPELPPVSSHRTIAPMSARNILRIHPADDLIVALRPLKAGDSLRLDGKAWTLREDIGAKHKFAARDFAVGELVKMYGVTVGRTTQAVSAGALVH